MKIEGYMKKYIILLAILAITGCASPAKYTSASMKHYDQNTDYAIEPNDKGFVVSVYYSRYQFMPESDAVAIACRQALTSIAHDHASKSGREIEQVNEQALRISLGRSGITGITSCSATAPAKWK